MTNQYNNDYAYTDEVKRFRRNKIDGVMGGVCSGIGDYTGIDPVIVRVLTVLSFFMTGGFLFWVYMGLWIFVPTDKRAPYRHAPRQSRSERRRAEKRAYAAQSPAEHAMQNKDSFRNVKSKFRSIETRLQDLERSITSSEWQLRRNFRDIE